MITVFTPSFADESNTNAQNLTVKEVVARMDPSRFRVVMLSESAADPRIAARPNTRILRWKKRGNTARVLWHLLTHIPDVYFFPREGPSARAFSGSPREVAWEVGAGHLGGFWRPETGHEPADSEARHSRGQRGRGELPSHVRDGRETRRTECANGLRWH